MGQRERKAALINRYRLNRLPFQFLFFRNLSVFRRRRSCSKRNLDVLELRIVRIFFVAVHPFDRLLQIIFVIDPDAILLLTGFFFGKRLVDILYSIFEEQRINRISLFFRFKCADYFAFSYLAQRRASMKGHYSLDRVRAWINCSEPVRRKSMIAFADAFADSGVSRKCLHASYAMAENVFAVTQTDLGKLPGQIARARVKDSTIRLDENAFELIDDVYFSSGRCLPEMRTRVVRADGSECAEREAGEIQLSTPCLFQGYWSHDGFRRDGFTGDGWYSTGDYGFFSDGELYVIGRMKDIIIVGGQNIFPEDLEVIAGRATGVYSGRVVAFGVDDEEAGTQTIGVVAEMAGEFEPDGARTIEREIRNLIKASLSVAPRYVRVVPQRWIIKSTAGKISRKDTRARFLAEQNSSVIETLGDQRES